MMSFKFYFNDTNKRGVSKNRLFPIQKLFSCSRSPLNFHFYGNLQDLFGSKNSKNKRHNSILRYLFGCLIMPNSIT